MSGHVLTAILALHHPSALPPGLLLPPYHFYTFHYHVLMTATPRVTCAMPTYWSTQMRIKKKEKKGKSPDAVAEPFVTFYYHVLRVAAHLFLLENLCTVL